MLETGSSTKKMYGTKNREWTLPHVRCQLQVNFFLQGFRAKRVLNSHTFKSDCKPSQGEISHI